MANRSKYQDYLLSPNYGQKQRKEVRKSQNEEEYQKQLLRRVGQLESKQASMDSFYQGRIKQLMRIIQKQQATKRGLEKDILALAKESSHQKHFVEHWRQQLNQNIQIPPISHQQQLINSAYLIPSPLLRTDSPKKEVRKDRLQLFRSANLNSRRLNQCKSDNHIQNEYLLNKRCQYGPLLYRPKQMSRR